MIDTSLIGRELNVTTVQLERGRLQFFAKATRETNPVYTDLAAARAAGYPDLPALPTFLFSIELDSGEASRFVEMLQMPLERVLHGEQGFTYHRMAFAGDTITVSSRITEIYEKKGGALQFAVKTSEARNQDNQLVAELRMVVVCRR